MNKSDFTFTALPTNFSTEGAPSSEATAQVVCPSIATDSLLCPGPGATYLYDVSVYCEDVDFPGETNPGEQADAGNRRSAGA